MSLQQNISERRQSLEAAFNLFNQLSEDLTGSYQELQLQVLQLSQELASARTERMLQLADKEQLADRLERLLETLPAGVIVLDGADRVREFNPAAARLLGSIALDVNWHQLRRRLSQSHVGSPTANELRLRNGRTLSLSMSQLEQAPGSILVMLDVTETRRLQERVNRQERLSAMGEMSAQLAHQMRTPLSSALLYTSHLAGDSLNPGQRNSFVGKLRNRLQHMERQIRDILLFARGSTAGEQTLSLSVLVEEFAANTAAEMQEAGVTLQLDLYESPSANILGCRDALQGVLSNLTDNALQHGATEIHIAVRGSEQITVRFADNGQGIPEECREQIFNPFFSTRSGGTGLGLAVVQNLVLHHRGEIRLLDTPSPGAVFELTFPTAGSREPDLPVADPDQCIPPAPLYPARSLS